MNYKVPVYYCGQCKKISNNLDQLLFVEDISTIGFCSEECIEAFYMTLVEYYEALDRELRVRHNIIKEPCLEYVGTPEYMDQLVSSPDEIWVLENNLKQNLYAFIKDFESKENLKFSICIICLVFNYQASFVILATATQNKKYKDTFRIGKKLENPTDFLVKSKVTQHEINLGGETLEQLENKKSQYLARLMTDRKDDDIPIEDFHNYEHFFSKTAQDPDEIYTTRDDQGDEILTYIKAYEKNKRSFFYLILFLVMNKTESKDASQLIPIISFPTTDGDVYKQYKNGELVAGNLKC